MQLPSEIENKVLLFLCEQNKAGHTQPNVAAICDGLGLTRQVVRRTLRSLSEKGMVSGPPDLLKQTMEALKSQDPKFTATNPGYAEHVVLMASAISKADETFLAEELDYDFEFVSLVGARLRAAGTWNNDHLDDNIREEWCREDGGISFYLDGAIATGNLMMVGRSADGGRHFKMTESGLADAAELIKRGGLPDGLRKKKK